MDPVSPAPTPAPAASSDSARREALMEAARSLEASFLAEMLSHAGMGESREAMGGGAGEDAFGSLLAREQARLMTEAGGIGLAQTIFESLLRREGGR